MLTKNAKKEKLLLQTLQTHQLMPLYSLDPAKLQKELALKTFGKNRPKIKEAFKNLKKVAYQHRLLQLLRHQGPLGTHV